MNNRNFVPILILIGAIVWCFRITQCEMRRIEANEKVQSPTMRPIDPDYQDKEKVK